MTRLITKSSTRLAALVMLLVVGYLTTDCRAAILLDNFSGPAASVTHDGSGLPSTLDQKDLDPNSTYGGGRTLLAFDFVGQTTASVSGPTDNEFSFDLPNASFGFAGVRWSSSDFFDFNGLYPGVEKILEVDVQSMNVTDSVVIELFVGEVADQKVNMEGVGQAVIQSSITNSTTIQVPVALETSFDEINGFMVLFNNNGTVFGSASGIISEVQLVPEPSCGVLTGIWCWLLLYRIQSMQNAERRSGKGNPESQAVFSPVEAND